MKFFKTIKEKQINRFTKQAGFTLIELILYVALIGIFIGGAVIFAWDIIYGRVKSQVQLEVNQNLRLVTNRINYEIRNASAINSVSSSSLSLANSDSNRNPTNIDFSAGKIRISQGTGGPCPASTPCYLTGDNVTVTALVFTDLSTSNTSNIKYSVSLKHNNPENRIEWDKLQTYTGSSKIRSD